MRITILDSYEFEFRDSEEYLAIACATKAEYQTANRFHHDISETVSDCQHGNPTVLSRSYVNLDWCIKQVAMATGMKIDHETVKEFLVYSDDWNDKEAIIETAENWHWCYWYTTA